MRNNEHRHAMRTEWRVSEEFLWGHVEAWLAFFNSHSRIFGVLETRARGNTKIFKVRRNTEREELGTLILHASG